METMVGAPLVPNATSYVVAPADAVHVNAVDGAISVDAFAGDGSAGAAGGGGGGGGGATVVNDHSGPVVVPPGPRAVIRQ